MGGEVLQFTKKERQHKALPFNIFYFRKFNSLITER